MDDLSRRPNPDLSGAIQHAYVALDAAGPVVVEGHPRTLIAKLNKSGKIVTPPPIDQAILKLWGYASQYGRHRTEGKDPHPDDAELAVHVAAAVTWYYLKKVAA